MQAPHAVKAQTKGGLTPLSAAMALCAAESVTKGGQTPLGMRGLLWASLRQQGFMERPFPGEERPMSRWLLVILIVLIAVLTAGSAVAKPTRTVAVGQVQGTEAYLAVTYDGHRLRAYACNGSARRLPTISTWFEAPWDGRSAITVVDGGVELRIDRVHADGRISGRLDGHRFALEPATGPAGLYEETSGTTTETSVVLANGNIRGTFVPTRPPKCRTVLVTNSSGQQQFVTVC